MIPFTDQAYLFAEYHQNQKNCYFHLASTIFIYLAMMILLGFVHVIIPGVVETNLATITAFALLVYYFRLNWRLALVILPVLIVLLWLASLFSHAGPGAFSLWSFLIILIIGSALHFTGYIMEGRRPPLLSDLQQLLLAPMFLTAEMFFMAGKMQALREMIQGRKAE